MRPRIDIDIRDYEGKTAELRDPSTLESFEIYLNDERVITSERVEELEEENARLREERDMYRDLVGNMVHPDIADQLHAENAKLRELADAVKEFVEDTHCEDCPCRRDCDDNNRIFCVNDFSYHAFARMRELGVGEDA
jgi:hypothetical protein